MYSARVKKSTCAQGKRVRKRKSEPKTVKNLLTQTQKKTIPPLPGENRGVSLFFARPCQMLGKMVPRTGLDQARSAAEPERSEGNPPP